MAAGSVHCVFCSPPFYGLRDYQTPATIWGGDPTCEHVFELETETGELRRGLGMEELSKRYRGGGKKAARVANIKAERGFCRCGAWRGHLGLEPTPQLFVAHIVEVFREVRRVLRSDGTCWINLGDSYANDGKWGGETGGKQAYLGDNDRKRVGREKRRTGLKPKDLIGIPWRVAFALQDDGWWLRQDNIWSKPNPMPESVTDRCTKSHEYIFMFSKSERYFFDALAIAEGLTTDEKENYPARSKILGRGTHDAVAERGNDRASSGGFPPREEGRNKRSVWNIATAPFSGEFCRACQTYFEGDALNNLHVEPIKKGDITERRRYCSCGSWHRWLSHFATFPTELAEIPIKAGTSEHGCCATCRAPWSRTVKISYEKRNGANSRALRFGKLDGGSKDYEHKSKITETVDWKPTCKCDVLYPLERAVVLDVFGGAGTTALVADRLGRDSILCELNPEYAVMSEQRIRGDATLFASVTREAAE